MPPPVTPSRPADSSTPSSPLYSGLLLEGLQRSPPSTFGGGCTNKHVGTMSNVWKLEADGSIYGNAPEISAVLHDLGEEVAPL